MTVTSLVRRLSTRENVLAAIMIVFALAVGAFSPRFIQPDNLISIVYAASIVGILGLGETIVLLNGGIDISVGAILAVCVVAMGLLVYFGVPAAIAVAATILLGSLLGALNGVLVAYLRVPAIIATLATLRIFRGVLDLAVGPRNYPSASGKLGIVTGWVGPVPNSVIIFLVTAILLSLFLAHTRLGRTIYAVGGNESAANVLGVNVRRINMYVYAICGFLVGVASVVYAARVPYVERRAGIGTEFLAIAAIVMGGVSIFGGSGKVLGTVLGCILMYGIYNALVLLGVDAMWQNAVTGALIILAVSLDALRGVKAHD